MEKNHIAPKGAFLLPKIGGCMSENQQIVETSVGIAASKAAAYGGSTFGAVTAWFGSIDLAFWISIAIALAGLAMNWYFARKKDKRDAIEHRAYLQSLEDKCNVKD